MSSSSHGFPPRKLPASQSGLRAGANSQDGQKYILVTGSNKGIGRAICQKLLEEHDDVSVFLCSRDVQRGQDAVKDIEKQVAKGKGRLTMIPLDTGSDESVQEAVGIVKQYTDSLYGIVNNAGVLLRGKVQESNNVNYFGPRRVNDAFLSMIPKGGRIVNIASASGPIFVSGCPDPALCQKLSQPWTIQGGLDELDEIASEPTHCRNGDSYGFSKALVSAYTWLLAKDHPDLVINAVTPGYINTDMTQGMGASNPPSKGAVPPVWLLMSQDLESVPTGRYYGSDCKRSPLDCYRGPGDPVYEGPDGK
ncbi:Carbonyl reductase [NADPH] 1 [Seminavis robusta]|uniref:Carbonyl reductase [NADPH] 1 n=1 Tax=Seminavis robusta TaxID=568900 RepID=A0A9N8EHC1_9STRA|nr:Carbonyl reductase [NADPH] 1 [Seminavis robusta]|eukprot:Sro1005_g230230.1 Carbonyl reductase [NADPH] 1 (307) ;mRNA; r:13639-14559